MHFSVFILYFGTKLQGLLRWLSGKESASQAGDVGWIPGSGRSPGGGMATHSSILAWKNPMGSGAWWAIVHRVAKSWPWLSDWACTCRLRSAGTRMEVDRQFSKLKSRISPTYSYIISSSLCFCFKDLEISSFLPKEKKQAYSFRKNCPKLWSLAFRRDQRMGRFRIVRRRTIQTKQT